MLTDPKTRKQAAIAGGIVAAGIVTTAALAMAVWPALTRPDRPAEAPADGKGVRIALVQPPKAAVARSGPLDVGLSAAAQAMAKGRQVISGAAAPESPGPTPRLEPRPSPRPAPVETTPLLVEDDAVRPPDGFDAARERWIEERERRADWERQRRERAAWEAAQRDRLRWEDAREQDRYDERRYDERDEPPPDEAPPERW